MAGSFFRLFVALVIAFPVLLQAQAAAPTPTPATCTNDPANATFELTAGSGAPIPATSSFSYTRKNDSKALVRLKNINPYSFKCKVTTSVTSFKEAAVSSFLGIVGGVANVGANTPNPAAAPTAPAAATPAPTPRTGDLTTTATLTPADCVNSYNVWHRQVESLWDFRNNVNHALYDTRDRQDAALLEFSKRMATLRSQSACTDVVKQALELASPSVGFTIAPVAVPADPAVPAGPASATTSLPMELAIDELSTRGQKLLPHLSDVDPACKTQLKATMDADTAFVGALINSTTNTPSAVSNWNAQVKALNAVRANLRNIQNNVVTELGNKSDFTIDTWIDGHQQVVTYTATCSPVTLQTIPAPDAAAAPAPAPTPTPSPAPANSWTHDFKFGVGPFFVLAGGMVISPLQQITFSTTATPGGSGATANTIIQQQNSSTRILPIAMLHARYWDQLPFHKYKDFRAVPNYLSVGVTAKSSDNKGTNIEYLFGPSWAFADRQFFITAGAYAGQQQRLANSLTVGSTTSLGSSNLPITQTTIWKAGFAITWAPAGK
jgi:hypothetical protein